MAAPILAPARGATVQIDATPNFDHLDQAAAIQHIYDVVVPACEARGVMLSEYGNHRGGGSLQPVENYLQRRDDRTLFNVDSIQEIFAHVMGMIVERRTYRAGSYGLKHTVERALPSGYCTNGDLIVAMMLHGFAARFGKRGEGPEVNCEFKVTSR